MSSDSSSSSPSPATSSPSPNVRGKRPARREEPSPSPAAALDEDTLSQYGERQPSPSIGARVRSLARSSKRSKSDHPSIFQGDELDIVVMHPYSLAADIGMEPGDRLLFEEQEDPDEDDSDLDPDFTGEKAEPAHRKQFTTSPNKRVPRGASIRTQAKRFVLAIDPNAGNCILTGNLGPVTGIQYAHIVPRATKPDDLTVLEYKWGMPYFSLYIDTRFNITFLRGDWHSSADRGEWALVPDHRLVDKIMTWIHDKEKNGNLDCISTLWAVKDKGNKKVHASQPHASTSKAASPVEKSELPIYPYYILPLSDILEESPLHRRLPGHHGGALCDSEGATVHGYPYTTVGAFRSHIQPHFVVYALGAKLAEKEKEFGNSFQDWFNALAKKAPLGHGSDAVRQTRLCLAQVRNIYKQWAPDVFPEVPRSFKIKKSNLN